MRRLVGFSFSLAGIVGLLAAAPPVLADDQGRIAGRILAAPDGAALADARVALHRFEPGTGSWQQFAVMWTDADGRYRFAGLAADRYRVCADSNAGVDTTTPFALYLPRCWRAAPTLDSADEIVLDPGSVVGGVTIRLPARGRIRGHVTDSAGAPVTGGYARVYWREAGRWAPGPWGYFDEDGGYELRVDDGRVHHVCFQPTTASRSRSSVGTTCPHSRSRPGSEARGRTASSTGSTPSSIPPAGSRV